MPGEATITLTLAPNSGQAKPFPFVLKKVMDIPPPNILDEGDDEIKKEKLCLVERTESGSDAANGAGSTASGGGAGGVSASLTPAIWEKTIPYDGENFHLEYMDLDEFLLENGIPISLEEELQRSLGQEQGSEGSSGADEAKSSFSSKTPATSKAAQPEATDPPQATAEEEKKKKEEQQDREDEEQEEDDEEEDDTESLTDAIELEAAQVEAGKSTKERVTPTPLDPEEIEVDVNFQPDPTDLVLSSVPGGELFNPRKHRFSEDELKPQPMIKKAKKVYVPDERKDDKYWCRRKKNNVAAKRSRDARRLKENQIAVRASFLERENAALRLEVAELRKDYGRCKNVIARYEAKYGPLTVLENQDKDM
ncbi:TEF transcription factor, PAR bZIP family member b [Alosa sapidissima]|uniref:TEF transcription factor, PAR bZIP family member b n=1 Tax=Alosa sapidissima TaxID=34773 RepID=UPI001C0855CE|nr:TEF transcription factor, PAR bZIP family member b [Alosa sapidissima]